MGDSSQNAGIYFYYRWVGFLYDTSSRNNFLDYSRFYLVDRGEKNFIFSEKNFKQKNI